MGDIDQTKPKDPEVTKCDEPRASIDVLREAKPSENIALTDPNSKISSTVHTVFRTELDEKDSHVEPESATTPIVTSNTLTTDSKDERSPPAMISPRPSTTTVTEEKKEPSPKSPRLDLKANSISNPREHQVAKQKPSTGSDVSEQLQHCSSLNKIDSNQAKESAAAPPLVSSRVVRKTSDIFAAIKDGETVDSTIFSVSGAPSRKVFKKYDAPSSSIFPVGSGRSESQSDKMSRSVDYVTGEKTRPISSSSMCRNPLTGAGVEANDEYKMKSNSSMRKDGNPVLGLGYDNPSMTSSGTRVPPGGYSKGLW